MRKIAANIIFPITAAPLKNGHLIIDEDNSIIKVVNTQGELNEISGLEYYSGILVPGFLFSDDEKSKEPILLEQVQNDYTHEHFKLARYLWSRGIDAVNTGFKFKQFENWDIQELSKDFHQQLEHFTIDAATRFGIDRILGSFEPGKKPGVLLITGYDFNNQDLTPSAKVLRLV